MGSLVFKRVQKSWNMRESDTSVGSNKPKESFMRRSTRRMSMFLPRRSVADDSNISIYSRESAMETGKRRKPNFLNTYQLEPTDGKPKLAKIKELMLSVVSATCDGAVYEDCAESNLCNNLTDELHRRVKPLIPRRYRFIIQVIMAEKVGQDLLIGSRWLWNEDTDDHCTVTFEAGDLVATIIFHSIYLE